MRVLTSVGKQLALFTGIASGCVFTKVWLNKRAQKEQDISESNFDSSRPQNLRFGLGWGAGADLMVMEEADTGDIVFGHVDCLKEVEFGAFVRCYFDQLIKFEGPDQIGVVVRTPKDLKIIHYKHNQIGVFDYAELISRQWNKKMILKKLNISEMSPEEQLEFTKDLQKKATFWMSEIESSKSHLKHISEEQFMTSFQTKISVANPTYVQSSILEFTRQPVTRKGLFYDENLVVRSGK